MTEHGPGTDARRCALTVPSSPAFLPLVQGFVREYARETGFPPEELGRLDLVMEEAATNVIDGAFGGDESGSFDVVCERVPAGIQITVHDEGLPWDPSLAPSYDPEASLASQSGAGLGSFLIQRFADAVEFHNLGSRGKETVIVKYLPADTVATAPPAEEEAMAEGEVVHPAERAELEIGPLRREQAIEVCRCIYDAYRYTYVNEHLYYPDRVVALNESGDMVSAVASAPDGEVAGHAALVFPEDSHEVADLAVVATKAKFRGQSVARGWASTSTARRGTAACTASSSRRSRSTRSRRSSATASASWTPGSCWPTRRRRWPSRASPAKQARGARSSSGSST